MAQQRERIGLNHLCGEHWAQDQTLRYRTACVLPGSCSSIEDYTLGAVGQPIAPGGGTLHSLFLDVPQAAGRGLDDIVTPDGGQDMIWGAVK